jgi:hypothetical protein
MTYQAPRTELVQLGGITNQAGPGSPSKRLYRPVVAGDKGAGLRSHAFFWERDDSYLISPPSIAALAYFIASVAVVAAMMS